MLKGTRNTVKRARDLRKSMTLPEVVLWQQLRRRPGGVKFRRQHPSGPYVLDFYCDLAKVCIEVDGIANDLGDNPASDALRDGWLSQAGIRTMRIAAVDVLENLDGVIRMIIEECRARPLHHPASPDGPPPLQGGFS